VVDAVAAGEEKKRSGPRGPRIDVVLYRLAADAVVAFHFAFVTFVVLGGILVWRWPRVAWVHLPVALWGALIEVTGLICPLTPLEKWLRLQAGLASYPGGFIAHHMTPLLYPAGLTRGTQLLLGAFVVILNLAVYSRWLGRRRSVGKQDAMQN
jgi:hypothetical protein